MAALEEKFAQIRMDHTAAIRVRSARALLGSSVIRVFYPGTKGPLLRKLASLEIESLHTIRSQEAFRRKFEEQLSEVHSTVRRLNVGNGRIHPGAKWGHSTKVLCLHLRELMLHSRLLQDAAVARLQHYLYTPIDGIVLNELRRASVAIPFRRIKDIRSARGFYSLQKILGDAARREGVPRVWFDDVWAIREGDVQHQTRKS